MEASLRNHYFAVAKFIGILGLILWELTQSGHGMAVTCSIFLEGAAVLLCAVMYELEPAGRRRLWLIGEGILAVAAVFLFSVAGIYFAAILLLDLFGERRWQHCLLCYLLLLIPYRLQQNVGLCFLILTFLILLYLQHCKIVSYYQRIVGENQQTESRLKHDMEQSRLLHRDELRQSRLQYENNLLEERARISQALHDKLGHSINGSLYKLEAAKLLIGSQPEKSAGILQEVIDNLRGSMDEIRVILRNERPDKKRMAMKSLQALCDECEAYHIRTTLTLEPEDGRIPEPIWEVILDNSFEAVTNSLRYSGCDEITIRILVLGEVVRCTVSDNGRGAEHVTDGMGIQGMRQRVRNAKGYLDIQSRNGFTINMILPIK